MCPGVQDIGGPPPLPLEVDADVDVDEEVEAAPEVELEDDVELADDVAPEDEVELADEVEPEDAADVAVKVEVDKAPPLPPPPLPVEVPLGGRPVRSRVQAIGAAVVAAKRVRARAGRKRFGEVEGTEILLPHDAASDSYKTGSMLNPSARRVGA